MSDIRVAMRPKQDVRPAFMVQKLEGKRKQTIINFDQAGKKVEKVVEVDAGYLVTMAKGHSIRVPNDKELSRLGFDKSIPLIDMEQEGEVVGVIPNNIAA